MTVCLHGFVGFVEFPTFYQNREVLLAATLSQIGEKTMEAAAEHGGDVETKPITVIAMTAWRQDHDEATWATITTNPATALRTEMAKEGLEDKILSIWGKSFRHERTPSTALHCTSVQVHASVATEHLHAALGRAGYGAWYATPKDADGRPSDEWRIIWKGPHKQEAIAKATNTKGSIGIAKNDKSYCIRTNHKDYEQAWKSANPERAFPLQIKTELT